MRTFCFLLIAFILLAGCRPQAVPVDAPSTLPGPPGPQEPAESDFDRNLRLIGEGLEEATPQQVVEAYLELIYLGYLEMEPADLGIALDLWIYNMHNLDIWQQHLIQRRRLLDEAGLVYVEKKRYPYTVRWLEPDEITDGRLGMWEGWDFMDGAEVTLHFVVEGEEGVGYPPLLAVNGQQTVRLRREGESYKITFVYFPGAARKFYTYEYLDIYSDEDVSASLTEEFGESKTARDPEGLFELPGRAYDPGLAASYAAAFAQAANPAFYHAGDWAGNCMNFVCQSILHGFGDGRIPMPIADSFKYMTGDWYAGEGGGVLAWENVDFFWDFATDPGGPMAGRILLGAGELSVGDVVQTRPLYPADDGQEDPEDFAHALIVVEGDTLLLAQNSPSNYIYYSDLVDVSLRYYRPLALKAQ
ncbi:MAG: amidase domain-containing protein [Oscillospiraceae bacterium]|nr:amidase domain-containing protein [Oscillospiraceae bacterium]